MKYLFTTLAISLATLVLAPDTADAQYHYRSYRPYSAAEPDDAEQPSSYRNAPRSSSSHARRYRLYADINRPIHRYPVFPGYYPTSRNDEDLLPDLYQRSPHYYLGQRRYGGYRGWGGYGRGWGGWGGYGGGWGGAGVFLNF